ncbi:MAG: hypothetical protein AAFO04_28095 [Cyanobacteria bacterium J06592_8]
MEPLTATAILTLAFSKSIEKASEKLTEGALQKLDKLRQLIWQKVRGQGKVEKALQQVEQGSESDVQPVVTFLETVMERDSEFTQQVQNLAQQINQEINIETEQSEATQNIFGGEGYLSNRNEGVNVQGGSGNTFNINLGSSKG